MIKLQIEDATLVTLDKALLPHVQWKSIRVGDLEGVDSEVLNTYLFKMSKPVIKSLIKNKRVNPSSLDNDQWVEVLENAYQEGWDVLSDVQMPYSAIRHIMENHRMRNRYGQQIARTQDRVPVAEALKVMDANTLNNVMFNNSNPALIHFMFTDEGLTILKSRANVIRHLRYLSTEEFAKVGRSFRNRRVSPAILRRASACDTGQRYCRDVLRSLNRDSITWNEAIQELRTNPVLRKRDSLSHYMDWVYERSEHLELAE